MMLVVISKSVRDWIKVCRYVIALIVALADCVGGRVARVEVGGGGGVLRYLDSDGFMYIDKEVFP